MIKVVLSAFLTLSILAGCTDKEDKGSKSSSSGMKCGSGKCGANMFDGNSALAKKKKNILSQMDENDLRKECVIQAKTTKGLYDCVRNLKTGKMSLKCGNSTTQMKCSSGKCGGN